MFTISEIIAIIFMFHFYILKFQGVFMINKIDFSKPQFMKYNTLNPNGRPAIKSIENNQFASIPIESFKAYNGISFTGNDEVITPQNLYLTTKKMYENTSESDTMAMKDAIKLLKNLNLKDNQLRDYLLGTSFDNGQKELVLNKKAVLFSIIMNYEYDVPAAKIPKVAASMLDNDKMVFDETRKDKFFTGSHFRTYSAKLKPLRETSGQTEAGSRRAIAMFHKQFIQDAIENFNNENISKNEFKSENILSESGLKLDSYDIFEPLKKTKNEMAGKLIKLNENGKISDELFKTAVKEINKGNFDIKSVYKDYYSLLDKCSTLEEAHDLYPELPIPFDKINEPPITSDKRGYKSRISKEQWDELGLNILKKIYIDFQPANDLIIDIKGSYPTNYPSLRKSGYDFGFVPPEINSIQNEGIKLNDKFKDFDKVSNEELETLIRHNASQKSRIWAEYIGITNKYWTKTRAIMHKQKNPDTTFYQTDKLIDGYLFSLYKTNSDVSDANPLKKYADGTKFNQEKKLMLEGIYHMYRNNLNPEITSPEFLEFKENFDIDEMQKSLTKLEKHYKNTFLKWFLTPERKADYQKALNDSYSLVLEKLELCDNIRKLNNIEKLVTEDADDEDLTKFIFEEDNTKAIETIEKEKFDKINQLVKESNNKELQQLVNNLIGENQNEYYQILDANIDSEAGGITDADKLTVLLKLHTEYISYVIENNSYDLNEESFTGNFLRRFTDENGEISYSKANDYLNAKIDYEKTKNLYDDETYKNFSNLIDSKFITVDDYQTGLEMLNLYTDMPDSFKPALYKTALNCDKVRNRIFVENLKEFSDKVNSWNIDNPEIITMDADKIPQQVVITSDVKKALWKESKGNIRKFDLIINKLFNKSTRRTGDRNGQGIKTLNDGTKFDVELKILGDFGNIRIYGRKATAEDIKKYGNVKYVFDTFNEHL